MILDSARGGFSHVSIICTLERVSEGVCECLRPARTTSHRRRNGFCIGGRHNVGMGVAGWSRGCYYYYTALVGSHGPLVATTICYDYASANLARTPLSSVVQYSGYYINKNYVLDLL